VPSISSVKPDDVAASFQQASSKTPSMAGGVVNRTALISLLVVGSELQGAIAASRAAVASNRLNVSCFHS